MSMFQQRHYEAIAGCLRNTLGVVDVELAQMFQRDNPKFLAEKFYAAIDQSVDYGDADDALVTALQLLFDGKPKHVIMASLRKALPRR